MKFPCWSEYDSVYDGVELEMHIVDHCNLNCAGCNHFCSLAEPFYISLESFTDQLRLVKEKIPSLKWLMLLGGEPTLHPQIFELCAIAREIFPDITIEILSNGKDLSRVIDRRYEFDELNIIFTIANYNIDYNKEDRDKMLNLKNCSMSWGRESFTQTLVDITGSQDMKQSFFYECHHQLPCFTLQDYKIYECPFAAHIRHFSKKFNIDIPLIENVDFLSLKNLTLDKLEHFAYQPKNICKYCKTGENWVWHLSDGSFNEYTKNMKELYFADYKKYEAINRLKPLRLEKVDPNFGLGIIAKNNAKFNGKLDIIIPYYNISNTQVTILLNSLVQQTIIKDCMIYLISDNSPNETYLIQQFRGNKDLNVTFLKNEKRMGPGVARNKGIDQSFNDYIIFLDSDDYLFDPNSLEQIYKILSTTNYDVVATKRQNEFGEQYQQVDYACSRKYLDEHQIRFGEYFLHEDLFFTLQISMYNTKMFKSSFNGTIYVKNNELNLSSTTSSKDKIISKYFTIYNICKKFKEENNKECIKEFIIGLLNTFSDIPKEIENIDNDLSQDPQTMEYIYYILIKSINLIKEYIPLNRLNSFLQSLINDDFVIRGSKSKSFQDLQKQIYCNDYNNLFLQPIIKELKGE